MAFMTVRGAAKTGSCSQCNQLIINRYIISIITPMTSGRGGGEQNNQGGQLPLCCT